MRTQTTFNYTSRMPLLRKASLRLLCVVVVGFAAMSGCAATRPQITATFVPGTVSGAQKPYECARCAVPQQSQERLSRRPVLAVPDLTPSTAPSREKLASTEGCVINGSDFGIESPWQTCEDQRRENLSPLRLQDMGGQSSSDQSSSGENSSN